MDYQSLLAQQTSNLGDRVFKEWGYNSDGIGTTMQDFYRTRPDLFQGVNFDPRRVASPSEYEAGGDPIWDFGKAGNDALSHYKVQRRGEAGMKDGRRDVVIDSRTGETVYAGANPYTHDPAKTNLKDAATFAALVAGGYYGVNALGGMGGGAAAGGATGGAGGAASGAGIMEGGGLINGAFANTAATAGTLAPGGVGALIPTGAQLGAMGGGSLLAGGLLGGGVAAPAAGAATGGAMADGMKQAGGKALDWMKANPKLAGKLAGGLLGGVGGGAASGGGGQAYNGPMPTITRGNWQPQAQAQMMQVPSFGGGLLNTQGNAGSGLWRYGK